MIWFANCHDVDDNKLADRTAPKQRGWLRVEDYFEALARRRTARHQREPARRRTQPEDPRLLLSTLPFLALISALIVLVVGIAWLARPGREPIRQAPSAEQREPGTAPPGWIERSKRG